MKKTYPVTADASGNIPYAGGSGISFIVIPAGSNPGGFPLNVQRHGGKGSWRPDAVLDGVVAHYGGKQEEFDRLGITGATPGGTYRVIVGTHELDRMDGPGISMKGTAIAKSTDSGLAINAATNAPTLSTQGIPLGGLSAVKWILEAPAGKTLAGGQMRWWDYDPDLALWVPDPDIIYQVQLQNPAQRRQEFVNEDIKVGYGRAFLEPFNITTNDNTGTATLYGRGLSR